MSDDVLILTPEMELEPVTPKDEFIDAVAAALDRYDRTKTGTAVEANEANFGFYVDGYCLASTDQVGEILVTAPDGRAAIIRSDIFTAFLERRLSQ